MYGKALELSIAREQMNGNVAVGNYTTTDGKTLTQGTSTIEVDYSGNNVVCNEMYDVNVPFRRTSDEAACEYCDFKMICGR